MSKKDLIIGGAFGYNWSHLKYFVSSIKDSGFNGAIALCVENVSGETVTKLESEGVLVLQCESLGSNIAPHVGRFFHIGTYLRKESARYNNVIVTDTRDVIFQKNPSTWIEKAFLKHGGSMIVSSEGIRYKNEPWGDNNLYQTFGPHQHAIYRENIIYNVGVIAGQSDMIGEFLLRLYQECIKRPIAICDQSVYNMLVNDFDLKSTIIEATNIDGWAAQLGTTIYAIASGAGDIGQMMPIQEYQKIYEDKQPVIKDGYVYTPDMEEKFVIVHQYDRVPMLKEEVLKRYANI